MGVMPRNGAELPGLSHEYMAVMRVTRVTAKFDLLCVLYVSYIEASPSLSSTLRKRVKELKRYDDVNVELS